MKGVYTTPCKITGVNSARTVIFLKNVSSRVLEILEAKIEQCGSNTSSQQLQVGLQPCHSPGSISANQTLTSTPQEYNDQASAITAYGDLTAEPTYAGYNDRQAAPSIGGYWYLPRKETCAYVAPSDGIGLVLLSAPTSADFVCHIKHRELG